jgi:hypothetical protein
MAINDWWAGDPAERYWMEITDREDLGDDLRAPTLNGTGKPYWGYTLVTETQPGDVVLHWHKKLVGQPALIGWSQVTGPLSEIETYTWQARGTRGRARGVPTTGPGWRMPCGGLNRLPQPITSNRFAALEHALREVNSELASKVRGRLYFPFTFYRARPLRATQAYLTKFPAALLRVVPELAPLAPGDGAGQPAALKATHVQRTAGNGYLRDPKLRKVIEVYAVDQAKRHYFGLGATEVVELGKPYDLHVKGLGPDLHVEVKGSSGRAVAVELTVNEIRHAHNHKPTDLVVVDEIEVRKVDDDYQLSSGKLRIWRNWRPEERHLSPTQFRYDLPEEGCDFSSARP